ncbi:MAG: hypothetical protein NC191_06945 [Muribaculaceae bacterium]|nr:hypothetical protein [Muribaculaceae bacterium]
MFIAKNNNFIILARDTREELESDLKFLSYDSIEETDIEYKLVDGVYITDEEAEGKERERINKLTMTKRVFALILTEYGITYSVLKQVIESNERAQLEWDLCVELERSNPLLDMMAGQEPFNLTPEDLDNMFKYANGELEELPQRVDKEVKDELLDEYEEESEMADKDDVDEEV